MVHAVIGELHDEPGPEAWYRGEGGEGGEGDQGGEGGKGGEVGESR